MILGILQEYGGGALLMEFDDRVSGPGSTPDRPINLPIS